MAMTQRWVRFRHHDKVGFGTTNGDEITEYAGDLFAAPEAIGRRIALAEIEFLPPVNPSKIVALWNNFHALSAKLGVPNSAIGKMVITRPSKIAYLDDADLSALPASAGDPFGLEPESGESGHQRPQACSSRLASPNVKGVD